MHGLTVQTPRVTQLAGGVTDTGDGLGREIASIQAQLDQVQAGWQSSSAAPRFASVMQAHLSDVAALRDALLSHGASLVTAAHGYDEAEAAVAGGLTGA